MELAEFVKTSLVGIVEGVRGANEALATSEKDENCFVLERSGGDRQAGAIHFDVAVTASSAQGVGGKGGVEVLGVSLGAVHGEHQQTHEAVTRLRFKVDVNHYLG